MYTKKEAELQLLDDQFRTRITDAKRNITTMQKNETNAVNNNNNNEIDHHSSHQRRNHQIKGKRGGKWQ